GGGLRMGGKSLRRAQHGREARQFSAPAPQRAQAGVEEPRAQARMKMARAHATFAHQQADDLYNLPTRLLRENQMICGESLAVKHLMRHLAPAKAISDAGWGDLVRQVAYKLA